MRIGNSLRFLALCLIFHAVSAWSLGLGDARVQSFIGQPLELRIDLLTAPTDDLDSVTARLGSADDFALIGASRAAIRTPLRFSIHEGEGDSGAYVLVTSREPVSDPVLRLVIEVSWSSGRLLREYTVFLDPPTVPSRAPEPMTAGAKPQPQAATAGAGQEDIPDPGARTAPPPPDSTVQDGVTTPESTAPPLEPSEPEPVREVSAGETYGPVRSGETLWRVASDYVGQSGMDMNQVMLAIQRKNPDAFVSDNINLLMRGATLEMPSENEVDEISRQRARELVAQQEAAFRMRSSLASASTPLLAGDSRPDVPRPATANTESSPDAGSASRLEIVPASEEDIAQGRPGTGAVPGGEGADEIERDVREELARTEEDLISERQQNEYLRERINELEAQLAEAEGVSDGSVADDDLANLEDRLQSERLAEAEAEPSRPTPGSVPSVTTGASEEEDRPWYSGPLVWALMVVIVIAAAVGWIINRRRSDDDYFEDMGDSGSAVSRLAGEAEEILRTLDSDRTESDRRDSGPGDAEEFQQQEADVDRSGEDQQPDVDEEAEPVVSMDQARRQHVDDATDAKVLDENSSDPEIKLDLARAYISMGDKEAARVILDEVLNSGSEQQRSEAQSMMDEL